MTQCQLNRSVARATGENLGTIRHMGFSVADPDPEHVHFDPEPCDVRAIEDRIIDWKLYELGRNVPLVTQPV